MGFGRGKMGKAAEFSKWNCMCMHNIKLVYMFVCAYICVYIYIKLGIQDDMDMAVFLLHQCIGKYGYDTQST